MMLPTHAFAGMILALPYALAVPELGGAALLGGLLGGILPDLDMYAGHRKTLHYPVGYAALSVVLVPVALIVATAASVALAFLVLGAALHSLTDVLGGGLELRPWEGASERAVYDHYRGRWIAPRRWIRYDGAPEDLFASVALAVPLVAVLDGAFRGIVVAGLVIAVVYAVVRRHLPRVAEQIVQLVASTAVPSGVLARVPDRYLTGSGD